MTEVLRVGNVISSFDRCVWCVCAFACVHVRACVRHLPSRNTLTGSACVPDWT